MHLTTSQPNRARWIFPSDKIGDTRTDVRCWKRKWRHFCQIPTPLQHSFLSNSRSYRYYYQSYKSKSLNEKMVWAFVLFFWWYNFLYIHIVWSYLAILFWKSPHEPLIFGWTTGGVKSCFARFIFLQVFPIASKDELGSTMPIPSSTNLGKLKFLSLLASNGKSSCS